MENYLIYRILNLKTRKFYIGRTTTSIKNRWSVHIAHAKYGDKYSQKSNKKIGQTYLYRTMRKYGIENFEIKQIDEAKSYDHMVFLENFYIKYYNSLDAKYGYNLVTDEYDSGNRRIKSKESLKNASFGGHYKNKKASGVGFDKFRNKFYLKMKFMGKNICTKRFDTEEEAKITHDKLELFYYKDNPLLYYPEIKNELLKENLEEFANKILDKKQSYSKYFGLSKCGSGFNIRIATGEKARIFIGFEKDETNAAIKFDKVAYYLGYNREELNLPDLWTENYNKEGEEIFKLYSDPRKQVQCKGGKTSKYNGVSLRSTFSWEMSLVINKKRIRENYREEIEAAKAYDFYCRQNSIYLNRLNFPNEIIIEKPEDIKPKSKDSYKFVGPRGKDKYLCLN